MLKPISAFIGMQLGLVPVSMYAFPNTAVSVEARSIQQSADQVLESLERSEALFGVQSEAITKLWNLANECSKADWDGSGANPIDNLVVFNAVAFVRAMPRGLTMPEFSPEPDGSISLDWIQSRTRVFTISFSSRDRLAYAWLDGSDRGHGVTAFDRNVFPQRILDGINAIMAHGNTSVRVV